MAAKRKKNQVKKLIIDINCHNCYLEHTIFLNIILLIQLRPMIASSVKNAMIVCVRSVDSIISFRCTGCDMCKMLCLPSLYLKPELDLARTWFTLRMIFGIYICVFIENDAFHECAKCKWPAYRTICQVTTRFTNQMNEPHTHTHTQLACVTNLFVVFQSFFYRVFKILYRNFELNLDP